MITLVANIYGALTVYMWAYLYLSSYACVALHVGSTQETGSYHRGYVQGHTAARARIRAQVS